jgi:hypothetical protein
MGFMPTISHFVQDYIRKKPFLEEALSRGIINNASLAQELIPIIQKQIQKKVKFSAVNLAIRRFAKKATKHAPKIKLFDQDTDLTLKSDLIELCLDKHNVKKETIKKIEESIGHKQGDFFVVVKGINEFTIITNKKYKQKIQSIIQTDSKIIIEELCAITITLPKNSIESSGLFYAISKELFWENISIVEAVSTFTEITLIIKEKDAPRILSILKSLIIKFQK